MKATQDKINKAFRNYKLALRKANKAEAAKLNGIDFSVLAKEGIIATIKRKLEFDVQKLKKTGRRSYKSKRNLKQLRMTYNLKTIRNTVRISGQENVSSIETFSKMNGGLVPIASFESWDVNVLLL